MIDRDQREWYLSQLIFADNTALAVRLAQHLQCLAAEFGRVSEKRKLRVNVEKSKFLVVGGGGCNADGR